jgi:hypothetical protein
VKLFLTCSIGLALVVGSMNAAQANDRSHFCKYPSTYQGNKKMVSCFAKKFGVSPDKARYIAKRESRFDEWAWNHSSNCRGLYQHQYAYWSERVARWHKKLRHWRVQHTNWYSPRAQAVVTMAMVSHGGWGPWGG